MNLFEADNRLDCDIDIDDNRDIEITQHLPTRDSQTLILTLDVAEKLATRLIRTIKYIKGMDETIELTPEEKQAFIDEQ